MTDFVDPGSTYRVDVSDAAPSPQFFRATELKVDHDPLDYETKQVSGLRPPAMLRSSMHLTVGEGLAVPSEGHASKSAEHGQGTQEALTYVILYSNLMQGHVL